jgi:hypothetical protein
VSLATEVAGIRFCASRRHPAPHAAPQGDGGDLYDPDEVRRLFDRMSGSYDRMNLVMSLGFSAVWRRGLLALTVRTSSPRVLDLMSGRGETWPDILRHVPDAEVTAIDFSAAMAAHGAARSRHAYGDGLKTFDADQLDRLAADGVPDAPSLPGRVRGRIPCGRGLPPASRARDPRGAPLLRLRDERQRPTSTLTM